MGALVVGSKDTLGTSDGSTLGDLLGVSDATWEDDLLGEVMGDSLGGFDIDGDALESVLEEGDTVVIGVSDGTWVGAAEGSTEGEELGTLVGSLKGSFKGEELGASVWRLVGE